MADRLVFDKGGVYCNKVLIGKWFDDRAKYVRQPLDHISTYEQDYVPKERCVVDPNFVWDQRIFHDGLGSTMINGYGGPFQKNSTTTTDISYNILPCLEISGRRCKKYDLQNIGDPVYGNMTNYGLRDAMKEKWKDELQDPPKPSKSEMKDKYTPPDKKDYTLQRRACPRIKTSNTPVNKDFDNLPLRGRKLLLAPESIITTPKAVPCPLYIKSLKFY